MEQLAWAALVDTCKNGVLDFARAALRNQMLTEEQGLAVAVVDGEPDWRRLLDDTVISDNGISIPDLDAQVAQQLRNDGVESRPASALVKGTFEDYLRGLRRDGLLEPYYVPRDLTGLNYACTLFFNDIVRYLHSAGFAGGYLFIDDIENLTDQMARRHRNEFAKEFAICTVRPGYANGDQGFFSCVLTTHQQSAVALAQAWNEAGFATFAPLDPGASTSVELPMPTHDQARAIIVAHLDYYRINHGDLGSINPFTEAGLQTLVGKARHPRDLLSNAAHVMRHAVGGETTAIDPNRVEEALSGAVSQSSADYTEGIEGAI